MRLKRHGRREGSDPFVAWDKEEHIFRTNVSENVIIVYIPPPPIHAISLPRGGDDAVFPTGRPRENQLISVKYSLVVSTGGGACATAYPLTCPIITLLRARTPRRRGPAVFLEFTMHGNCTPRPRYVHTTRDPAGRVAACPGAITRRRSDGPRSPHRRPANTHTGTTTGNVSRRRETGPGSGFGFCFRFSRRERSRIYEHALPATGRRRRRSRQFSRESFLSPSERNRPFQSPVDRKNNILTGGERMGFSQTVRFPSFSAVRLHSAP